MSALDPSDVSSRHSRSPAVLLVLAFPLVLLGVAGMFYEMIGSSHNDYTLEWPWYFGSAALVVAAALSLTSIVSVSPRRPWWLVIAYLLCIAAGCLGLWGLSVPLLNRIG